MTVRTFRSSCKASWEEAYEVYLIAPSDCTVVGPSQCRLYLGRRCRRARYGECAALSASLFFQHRSDTIHLCVACRRAPSLEVGRIAI